MWPQLPPKAISGVFGPPPVCTFLFFSSNLPFRRKEIAGRIITPNSRTFQLPSDNMWTQASSLLLLLFACSFWTTDAQDRRQNIWNDPITFSTKARDKCTMVITGHGETTKLRLSCQGPKRSYWCEYVGKPYLCGSFNKNPRHYFVQMMWGLRKLNNACQAPRAIKPHMCRKATDESQMVFSAASFPRQPERQREASQARVQQRPAPTGPEWRRHPESGPIREMQRVGSKDPAPTPETHKQRMARLYCWKSMQGVCAYVIGLFRE